MFVARIAGLLLKMAGWTIQGELPSEHKFIVIVAPHTSNWDFIWMLLLGLHWRAIGKTIWFGKHTIFKGIFGTFLKKIGGIPINRSEAHRIIDQTIEALDARDELILALAPEGTRKFMDHWKSGFYIIALRSHLPVALGFINYPDKKIGITRLVRFTGHASEDWAMLQGFYQQDWARYPSAFSKIKPRRGK